MHDSKTIDGSYFCSSLRLSSENSNGMKDIFCGPKYILKWDGNGYEMDGN